MYWIKKEKLQLIWQIHIFLKFTLAKACNFIKKESLGEALSSEFCEIHWG